MGQASPLVGAEPPASLPRPARYTHPTSTCSEEVLWSALFALAVIARDSGTRYVPHLLALVHAGVLPALRGAMSAYRQRCEATAAATGAGEDSEADDMILRAGDYLVQVLTQARRLLYAQRGSGATSSRR